MRIELIQRFETEGKLITALSVKRGIPKEVVVRMLRYNVLTPNQFASLTGKPLSQIMNLCRPGKKTPAVLKQVGIMPEWKDEQEIEGRLYILRNETAEQLLLDSVTE